MSTWLVLYVVSCPPLTDPSNGMMNCSLGDDGTPSYEDTCSFTCNTGYQLTGSDTRTCQSDGSWSGSDAMCERGEYNLNSTLTGFKIFHKYITVSVIIIYLSQDNIEACFYVA